MKSILATAIATLSLMFAAIAEEGPQIGQPAPDFTLPNLEGENVTLSDMVSAKRVQIEVDFASEEVAVNKTEGRYVVLEWINYDCPWVVKHYSQGHMQALQNRYMEKGVVWLAMNSSAPGKQGHFEAEEGKKLAAERNSTPTAILLDPDGVVGRKYRARATPHMFVIAPDRTLLYMGAIDDNPSRSPDDIATAQNYVAAALDAALAGEEIETTVTRPYGCSVKY